MNKAYDQMPISKLISTERANLVINIDTGCAFYTIAYSKKAA